ncbi:MAG: flagellar biosynthesis protein FlhB [Rubrimonas sp.]
MAGGQGGEDGQEKSFDPTPRRIQQAREKGDIAVSQDLHVAAAYLGMLAALLILGGGAAAAFGRSLTPFLGHVDQLPGRILGPGGLALSAQMVGWAFLAASPLILLPAAGVIASLAAQQGVVFAPGKIEPKLSRISPIATAKNKFGPTGLMEFAKSAVKMAVISAVVWWWLMSDIERIVRMATLPGRAIAAELGSTLVSLLMALVAIALSIGAVDFVWQRFNHLRKLKMSLQEMKDENKETEGDPHAKQARRRRAEEIATNRMLTDVPKADVVIVNPTHYAVALKWSRKKGSAPTCVAKGVDEVAARIREKAAEAGVPIHHDPPTARALYASVNIGREIRPEHYRAVAAAIRFAEEMRRKARAKRGGWEIDTTSL